MVEMNTTGSEVCWCCKQEVTQQAGFNMTLDSAFNATQPSHNCSGNLTGAQTHDGRVLAQEVSHAPETNAIVYVRFLLLSITCVAMAMPVIFIILVHAFRDRKPVKAASAGILQISLVGSLFLYSEALVLSFPMTSFTCAASSWFRHIGFCLVYVPLLLKTWRISTIMRMPKTLKGWTKDSDLYKVMLVLLGCSLAYLTIWQVVDGHRSSYGDVTSAGCSGKWWFFAASLCEGALVAWGLHLCYCSRHAPDSYNDSYQVALSCWNYLLWSTILNIHRFFGSSCGALASLLLLHLRIHATVTCLLIVIFIPKFLLLRQRKRKCRGCITEVYGPSRLHRITLRVNKHGRVKTLYCKPCGPLGIVVGDEDVTSESPDGNRQIENQYTKEEVDSLIELVARLKSELNAFTVCLQRLLVILKTGSAQKENGKSNKLIQEIEAVLAAKAEPARMAALRMRDIQYDLCGPSAHMQKLKSYQASCLNKCDSDFNYLVSDSSDFILDEGEGHGGEEMLLYKGDYLLSDGEKLDRLLKNLRTSEFGDGDTHSLSDSKAGTMDQHLHCLHM